MEILLERVEGFADPKLHLEQYRLPAPAAAEMLWYIGLRHKDLENRIIGDLGCGTGMLSIGAAFMGADYVVGVDIDQSALMKAKNIADRFRLRGKLDLVRCRVEDIALEVDVVVQNPPFGVWKREADRAFLKAGITSGHTLYSLHKSGEDVRRFIRGYAEDLGARVDEILPLSIKLPPTYHFHKKKFHKFDIDLYRIVRGRD